MYYKIPSTIVLFIFFLCSIPLASAQVVQKIGDNNYTIKPSTVLELESTNKALLLPRVANTAAIVTPFNGMVVYDISSNCLKSYENGAWSTCLSAASSLGTVDAVCTGFAATTSAGTMVTAGASLNTTYTVKLTNNTLSTVTLMFLTSDLVLSGVSGGIVSGVNPSTSTNILSGATQTITYTVTGTPTVSGTLTGSWKKLSVNCSSPVTVAPLSSRLASTYCTDAATTVNGSYTIGTAMTTANTFKVLITNTSGYALNNLVAPKVSDLVLSGASAGLSVLSVSPSATIATLVNNSYQTFTYTLGGTPTATEAGVLTATWSYGDLSCAKTTNVNLNPSTNGTAVVSSYPVGTAAGTMVAGSAVSGVTQTMTVTATTAGTYDIATAAVNGVTFAGTGTLIAGSNTIILTASGTPTNASAAGSFSYVLNTNPSGTFTRTVNDISTNGTAIVSAYSWPTALSSKSGDLVLTFPVSGAGITQTITANVTTIGSYAISAVANGVTFSGSGTFVTLGIRSVILTATAGTPTAAGSNDFVINTTPDVTFTKRTDACGAYVSASTYKGFQCYNLGSTDTTSDPNIPTVDNMGSYYQWGRSAAIANTPTTWDAATMGTWDSTLAPDYSWAASGTLAKNTTNDPCPTGFRVPRQSELVGIWASNTSPNTVTYTPTGTWTAGETNYSSAIQFAKPSAPSVITLTLPAAGCRRYTDGMLTNHGSDGFYWSSTEFSGTSNGNGFNFVSGSARPYNHLRIYGFSVRCVSE